MPKQSGYVATLNQNARSHTTNMPVRVNNNVVIIPENPQTFIQAVTHFFGYRHAAEAMNELRSWSQVEKDELKQEMEKLGYWIINAPTISNIPVVNPHIKPIEGTFHKVEEDDEHIHAKMDEPNVPNTQPDPLELKKVS